MKEITILFKDNTHVLGLEKISNEIFVVHTNNYLSSILPNPHLVECKYGEYLESNFADFDDSKELSKLIREAVDRHQKAQKVG